MQEDIFTPNEVELVNRLRSVPRPQLKPDTFKSIQQMILQEAEVLPRPPQPRPTYRTLPGVRVPFVVTAGMVVVIVLVTVVMITSRPQQAVAPSSPSTASPTIAPTTTSTEENLSTTTVPSAPSTAKPIVPQPTSDTNAANASSNTVVVMEGMIQDIKANIILIDDMQIQIDPQNPILKQLLLGQTVRVEGYFDMSSGTEILIAINIVIINPTLPMNCKVSKNGHLHCTKPK